MEANSVISEYVTYDVSFCPGGVVNAEKYYENLHYFVADKEQK